MVEVVVAPETRAALAANRTMRFLLKTRYDRDSRHSKVAISWAQSRAEMLTKAVLEHTGQQTSGHSIQMNIVELLSVHQSFLCFDLFLDECDKDLRSEVQRSFERPVHIAARRGKVHYVQRCDKKTERMVAERYSSIGELDKGPLPYFVDVINPPIYDEGYRLEEPEEGDAEPETAEAVASISEAEKDGEDGPEETRAGQLAPKESTAEEVDPTIQTPVDSKVNREATTSDGENNTGERKGKRKLRQEDTNATGGKDGTAV